MMRIHFWDYMSKVITMGKIVTGQREMLSHTSHHGHRSCWQFVEKHLLQ